MAGSEIDAQFEQFVRDTRQWLRREAYLICDDWYEADDLVQVALCHLYRRRERLTRHTELGAYARRVIVRSFLTERRRARWRHEVAAVSAWEDVPAPGRRLTVIDDRVVLVNALRRLGPRQRAVLALRFLHDLSVERTAQVLRCTPGTVTSQTVRALETLRRDLHARSPGRAVSGHHRRV